MVSNGNPAQQGSKFILIGVALLAMVAGALVGLIPAQKAVHSALKDGLRVRL